MVNDSDDAIDLSEIRQAASEGIQISADYNKARFE
ncbi:jg3753, partial [Pararge aegeria aegeria]